MSGMDPVILVLTNVPDAECGAAIARRLVEDHLSACVNVLPGVRSVYRWQDAIEESKEITLMIKTTASRYAQVEAAIKAMHPYDLPEVVALPVTEGSLAYLDWVRGETRKDVDV